MHIASLLNTYLTAGEYVFPCRQMRWALQTDAYLAAVQYVSTGSYIRIRQRVDTVSAATEYAFAGEPPQGNISCYKTSKKLFANKIKIVREQFYVCLSRNDRPTDKMVFTRTRSTIVLHGMYLYQRVFDPEYSSPKMRMRFAGNLYTVCVKFLTCSP